MESRRNRIKFILWFIIYARFMFYDILLGNNVKYIFVDKNQKFGPWTGTNWATAYTQINGLAMNSLASSGSNVTMLIAAGVYKEKIDIRSEHSGVKGFTNYIKGYTNGVIIDGENLRFCIEFGADGNYVKYMTIENIRCTRGNDQNIRVMWCSNVSFKRLIVDRVYSNPNGWGFFVGGSSYYNKIINCTIISNKGGAARGICLGGDAYGTEIKNCIIAYNREGVLGASVTPPTILTYNDVVSNSVGNYNSVTPGVGTITNDPLFVTTDPVSLDFVKLNTNSPCIDKGDPSYYDVYMVNGRVDIGAREFEGPKLCIVKSISNLYLNNNVYEYLIPGVTILYKISYSNTGIKAAKNCIIYDKVNQNTIFKTQNSSIYWTNEYSTNFSPDQSWTSTNYSKNIPGNKEKIHWIRWKKSMITSGENGSIMHKVILK